MLLLLFNQPGGSVPVYARAPAGNGYTRAAPTTARPVAPNTVRPAQQNTKRP